MPLTAPPAVVVPLPHGRAYTVHFEPLDAAARLLREAGMDPGPALVVTDETVGPLYLDRLTRALRADGWRPEARAVPAGEGSKTLGVYGGLVDWALGLGVDRQTPVLALGGGVVGDLAGFIAATLLRGLPFVQVPTTVIAQVDSAIGGKTGVNHEAGKNLVGAFHQPRVVLADPATLQTLPRRELASGLAEAVKHALIRDPDLAARLDQDLDRLLDCDAAALARTVRDAAAIKAAIVAADEREAGDRAILNFGHTFGHAIEKAAGYGAFTHGEAVALGMRAALHLSSSLRLGRVLAPDAALPDPFAAADRLVSRLPTPALPDRLSVDTLLDAMGGDKKRRAGRLRFVVLDAIGDARLAEDVDEGAVRAAWRSVGASG